MRRRHGSIVAMASVAALAASAHGAAATIALDPPPEGQFVLDLTDLLTREEEQAVNRKCTLLFDEQATPIVVVTIDSMADHWPHGAIRIETFAQLLFDQWEIGAAEIDGHAWNNGILLLVSKGDRKARIQLGGGWGPEFDERSRRFMDGEIVPQFKKGRYGAGIVAGVGALDAMARSGRPLARAAERDAATPLPSSRGVSPARRGSFSLAPLLGCFGIVLVVAIVGGLLSRIGGGRGIGGRGMGWGVGGFLGGMLLGNMMSRGTRRVGRSTGGFSGLGGFGGGRSGGGFSGGGFRGGGFSRGGGATGSW
jgi:uncharacterized protein